MRYRLQFIRVEHNSHCHCLGSASGAMCQKAKHQNNQAKAKDIISRYTLNTTGSPFGIQLIRTNVFISSIWKHIVHEDNCPGINKYRVSIITTAVVKHIPGGFSWNPSKQHGISPLNSVIKSIYITLIHGLACQLSPCLFLLALPFQVSCAARLQTSMTLPPFPKYHGFPK